MTINIEELEKHEEITSVSFDGPNAHLATTHFMQGGSASGWNQSLLLKGDEVDQELVKALEQVSVTLSMEEFLRRFFDMYSIDAEILTKIMGYETEEEYNIRLEREEDEDSEVESYEDWYTQWLEEKTAKVTLLEKAQEGITELSTEEKIKLLKLQETLEKALEEAPVVVQEESEVAATETLEKNSKVGEALETSIKESEDVSSAIGSDNLESQINKSEGENILMTKEVEKTAVELELEKAQEKLAELEKAQAKMAELEKAAQEKAEALEKAQERLVEFEKAENARIEKGYKNFAETLSYVEEKEELVGFLMKARAADVEGAAKFVEYLEKAAEAINALGAEQGFEGAEDEEIAKASSHKLLDDKIQTKYAGKDWL